MTTERYIYDPSKESCGNNAARSESPEEAIVKDEKTLEAWIGHPHLRVFDNSTNFSGKINKVVEELFSILGEPVPKEIERKFLIKRPTIEEIEKMGCISQSNIIQTYLHRRDQNVERRVRQRGTVYDGFSFYYTEKIDANNGERIETENKITPNEYITYLSEANTSLHQISKTRYCFVYKNKYYELDIFPFSDDFAILEIELNDLNEEIELPEFNIIKEVTYDDDYRNYSIARTLNINPKPEINPYEKWIYESGMYKINYGKSIFYNIFESNNFNSVFKDYIENKKNYISRHKMVDDKIIYENYDFEKKIFSD